jgi:hypothetical protein
MDVLTRLSDATARLADLLLPPSASVATAENAVDASPARQPLETPVRGIAAAAGLVLLAGVLTVAANGSAPASTALAVPAAAELPVAPAPGAVVQPESARPEARPGLAEVVLSPPSAESAPAPASTLGAAPVEPSPPTGPAARWLPTGTGVWLHDWVRTEGGDAAAVVARAQAAGLTHLYVQTGSTRKGWIGDEVLGQLLPATAGTGLRVIAWDFPKLNDPEEDARRMARAASWQAPGAPRVAAVAPDVETAAEGTNLSADTVSRYYATLRAELPPEIAILATVPWPSEQRTGFYPYQESAVHSDAFVPMAYWYNRSPAVVTTTSMQFLARFGLPVMPVGQGYDGRIDAPYLPEDPDPAASVQAFVDSARAGGASSISLWSWQTMAHQPWEVLARAAGGPWPTP